jgi:hypothetical protein
MHLVPGTTYFLDLDYDSPTNPYHDKRRRYGAEALACAERGSYLVTVGLNEPLKDGRAWCYVTVTAIDLPAWPDTWEHGGWRTSAHQRETDGPLVAANLGDASSWLAQYVLAHGTRRDTPRTVAEALVLRDLRPRKTLERLVQLDPSLLARILDLPPSDD